MGGTTGTLPVSASGLCYTAGMVESAMILAAGLGTRLRPLTDERPKPLVEVLGTPLVCFSLEHARRAGARKVALNTHHLHPAVERALGERYGELELVYSYEPEILGTGGGAKGMREALGRPSGPSLLLNADALLDVDTAAMAKLHEERRPIATLALKETPDQHRYGVLGTDEDDRVRSFAGRTAYQGPVARERMFCGVHVLEPAVLEALPEGFSGINVEGYPKLIDEGHSVLAFDVPGYFCDVGTPERLLEANLLLLGGRERLVHLDPFARFPSTETRRYVHERAEVAAGAELIGPVLVDEGAVIEAGARVGPFAVVGKGCRVERGAVLERVVLQSGASASGEVRDAVLSPTCRMDVDPAVGEAACSPAE